MDPMTIGLMIQGAGGIANFLANQSANEKAQLLQDENFRQWMALILPNPRDQEIALQQLTSSGTLSPDLEMQIDQAPSMMKNVSANPQTQAAQMNALNSLQDIGFKGGMTLADKAALQEAQQQNQSQFRGNQDAIMQNMAQRGATNSGFGVAAQIANNQAAGDRNAIAGLNSAATAQQRALMAIQGAGSLGMKMQSNDLDQQNKVAAADDVINKFNTTNMQNIQMRNVSANNDAQRRNIDNSQRINDTNVGFNNQAQIHNKGLIQQNYENQAKQVLGSNNIRDKQAGLEMASGQNMGNMFTNAANGVSGAMNAQANRDFWKDYWDKQKKTQGS